VSGRIPVSFCIALAGVVIALIGAGVFVGVVLFGKGWDAIWQAGVGMGINLLGWVITVIASIVSALRNPAWRRGSLALLVLAAAGIAFAFYVREHM